MAQRLFALVLACAFFLTGSGSALAGESEDPRLFGSREEKFDDISPFYKWTDVLSRFRQQRKIPALWERHDPQLRALPLGEKVKSVNNIINSYPYIPNGRKEPVPWQTPLEFLRRGGSCQGFAIAKYLWLEHLGVPEAALRVAIVYDRRNKLPHALSLVYDGGHILVLDNQDKQVRDDRFITRYKPIYAISRSAWWRYTGQGIIVDPAGGVSLASPRYASFLPTVK